MWVTAVEWLVSETPMWVTAVEWLVSMWCSG